MSGKIKGFLIDVYNKKQATEIEFEDTLDNIYKILDVQTIDVACIEVGGHRYDFIVDDEGCFRNSAIPSVFDNAGNALLVENVLVVNSNNEGDFTSLTDEQIESLKIHLRTALVFFNGKIERLSVLFGTE